MGMQVPDPVVGDPDAVSPEDAVLLADSVGLALQVVLETLTPAERLAFVMHDMFGLPFDEIGPMVGRSAATARQLASRARRRVRGVEISAADADVDRQREVVDAFYAAARHGDLEALVAVLHPDVVLRSDAGPGHTEVVHGADAVARRARAFKHPSARAQPVLVNGTAGYVVIVDGLPFAVMGFTVSHGRVTEVDIMADPERLSRLDLPGA